MTRLLAAVAVVTIAGLLASARAEGPASTAENGRQLYVDNCASCHGASAHGDGPMADQLRVRPSNLTDLTRRNGGMFPTARVGRIVDGRDVSSHGNPDMPVWGTTFTRRGLDDAAVKARIEAIVRFLDSIQQRRG